MTEVEEQLAALSEMPAQELRAQWQKTYGAGPPARIPRDLLLRAAAYRIQESACGGLDKKTKRTLRSMAQTLEANGRLPATAGPILKPGAKLIREWHGKTHRVAVLEDGFEFEGQRYRSLSKIAREITGAHWSGRRFFGLKQTDRTLPSSDGGTS